MKSAHVYHPDGTKQVILDMSSGDAVRLIRELVPDSSLIGFTGSRRWYTKLWWSGPLLDPSTQLVDCWHLDGFVILFTGFSPVA